MRRQWMKLNLGKTIRMRALFSTSQRIVVGGTFATRTPFPSRRKPAMENDRLIRLEVVGEMFGGVCVKTIRRRIAAGELPKPVYFGRTPMLSLSEVNDAIE